MTDHAATTGEGAMPDEVEIERLAREREMVAGFREAARRALAFARRYRAEEGAPGGAREVMCIAQAQAWRRAVRELHAHMPVSATWRGPGIARARSDAPKPIDGRKTG